MFTKSACLNPFFALQDHDLTARAALKIVNVEVPVPEGKVGGAASSSTGTELSFAKETVKHYEQALKNATEAGTTVRAMLVCVSVTTCLARRLPDELR